MAEGTPKGAVIPIEAFLLALTLLIVTARLCVRLVRQRQRLTTCDWLLVASSLDATALFVTDTLAVRLGALGPWPTTDADAISLKKVTFAGNYFYDTGVYLPKLALCALFFKLIPPTMPFLRRAMFAVSGLTLAFALTTVFLDTFWCGANPSVNWSLEEGACSTYESKNVFRIDWVMNIVSDILIFCLPFPLLVGLQVSRRYIIGIAATFSAGIVTIAASVSRFATVEVIHNWPNVYILSMTEMAAAIIVVSLPALKSLLHSGRRGLSTTPQYAKGATPRGGYGMNTIITSNHLKLSSGRDPYTGSSTQAASADDSGSEVELNNLDRRNVIYKTDHISEWVLIAVAFVFVALRVYTRLVRLREKLTWADWLLVASAINALGLIICDTLTFQLGVMDNWEPSVALSKIGFASNYFYDVGMGFPKLSMVAFYWAYFPVESSPGIRKVLWGITAFVCACYLAILFDDTFFCGSDVSVQWSQEEGACSVFYAPEPFILNFTLNLACYLVVYALPLALLIKGTLPASKGVTLTFVLGTLTIFTTIIRFVTLKVGTGQPNLVYPLSIVEMTLAIIVVALPGLKPLFDRSSRRESSVETVDVNQQAKTYSQ
ncbi:archaeal flagellin N-terminal-like domain-containing protein [Plectosphaerella plurivora]|uniref:Archaeal flagellin N-terminal-like domain-containing protein n=1 Tax=Plectosphaerella plurivora TaxID=936078 RepID=A0A9P9AEV8_9PEZI|nr:archaeal flagellin N-terminal-like domain-containing protein [Plectosphaerella plurivora]